jgi:ribosomal protein S24E
MSKTIENNNIELLKYYVTHFCRQLEGQHNSHEVKCPLATCVHEEILHMPLSMFIKLANLADADYIDNKDKLRVFSFVTDYHSGKSGIRPKVYNEIYHMAKEEAKGRKARDPDADTSDEDEESETCL